MSLALKRTRFYQTLKHWRDLLCYPEYRAKDRVARADFHRFCHRDGGLGLGQYLRPNDTKPKTALIVSQYYLPFARLEALMMKALQLAGFQTVVVGNRRYDFLRYGWLAGNKIAFDWWDFGPQGDPEWVDQQIRRLDTLHDWLNLEYQGVHVGRFAIAIGSAEFESGATQFH